MATYARNLQRREALRARGRCIECKQPNHIPEHWRCLKCRVIESAKQKRRYQARARQCKQFLKNTA